MSKTIQKTLSDLNAATATAAASLRADLEKIELDLVRAQNRLAEVNRAPVPKDVIESRLEAWLEAEEEESVGYMILSRFASPDYSPMERAPVMAFAEPRSSFGVLVALVGRDTIKKSMLTNALKAAPGDSVTDQDREREVTRLTAEITRLEKTRELISREAEKHGLNISRSEYADPAVLLAPDSEL